MESTSSKQECKFGSSCSRPGCYFAHPLSTDTSPQASVPECKFGTECKREGCLYSHSKLALSASMTFISSISSSSKSKVECKFGSNCTRPDCTFFHPPPNRVLQQQQHQPQTSSSNHNNNNNNNSTLLNSSSLSSSTSSVSSSSSKSRVECKFGSNCARPDCTFFHPQPNHVLQQSINSNTENFNDNGHHNLSNSSSSMNSNSKCRYDINCTKVGCPFLHSSPQDFIHVLSQQSNLIGPLSSSSSKLKTECKFGINCTKVGCPFLHPHQNDNNKEFNSSIINNSSNFTTCQKFKFGRCQKTAEQCPLSHLYQSYKNLNDSLFTIFSKRAIETFPLNVVADNKVFSVTLYYALNDGTIEIFNVC
jgi:hypothetical protein